MLKTDVQSAIMEPLDSLTFRVNDAVSKAEATNTPDVVSDADFKSISFIPSLASDEYEIQQHAPGGAFLLMDAKENLHIATPELFCKKLRCGESDKIKVVSIFGNTGDGKSHTMNHTFFGGNEVFQTSPEQHSCTIGAFAAMQHEMGVLCLDTEGLLGTTAHGSRRMRMLLKILAISDIVIYRTRSERLHSDMYEFLGTASNAFCSHFAQALQSLSIPGTAKTLGPAVIIFHETRHTKPLESSVKESAEDRLRESFASLNLETNAFSSLRYVGIQTETSARTDYDKLIKSVRLEVENTAVRSPRQPGVVFKAMKALNQKFSGEIIEKSINPFPEQYFTCQVHCESCSRRCQRSMGHVTDGENHLNRSPCKFQHQFNNKVYLCRICYNNGKEIVVENRILGQGDSPWYGFAKYAWTGEVIECPNCGEIYRSRKHWFGNLPAETDSVRSEVVHVWKGGNITAKQPVHSAQMVLDTVSFITGAVANISAPMAKAASERIANMVAPSYWKPNEEIIHCHACKINFERTGLPKHHCRGCGEGFCDGCSQHRMPVPARGWSSDSRVCSDCRQQLLNKQDVTPEFATESLLTNHTNSNPHTIAGAQPPSGESDVRVRKYGEALYNTISSVAGLAIEIPKEIIKETARPDYWVPDKDSTHCHICRIPFGTAEELALAKTRGLLAAAAAHYDDDAASRSVTPSLADREITGDCRRHHCRGCGQPVCEDCSETRRPVPERGWFKDSRVCDSCICIENTTLTVGEEQHAAAMPTNANDKAKAD